MWSSLNCLCEAAGHILAAVKRLPQSTANWVIAVFQSCAGFTGRTSALPAAGESTREPRPVTALKPSRATKPG